MFIHYTTKSYTFPLVADPVSCPPALEELELDPDEWTCAFLKQNFMSHKEGFLVVYKNVDSEKGEFYVEKHKEGRGKKVSQFRKVFKAVEERKPLMPDDDSNDNVVCYLDEQTRITSNSYCFKVQRLDKSKEEATWKSEYFYSDLAWALKGYFKHFLRKNKVQKEKPTVQDLYTLVVDVYKKIEKAVGKVKYVKIIDQCSLLLTSSICCC